MSKASPVSTINRVRSRLATAESALREAVLLMAEADARPDRAALERVAGHVAGIRAEIGEWTIGIALQPRQRSWEHEQAVRALLSGE
jgi:hypothetical protein